MSIREDQVANAVRFLQNDKTQQATDEQKKEFLKKKGLTDGEINEALHRYSGGTSQSSTSGAPLPAAPPQPMSVAPAPAATMAHAQPYDQVVYPNYAAQPYMPPPIYYPQRENNNGSWWKLLFGTAVAAGLGFLANNYYRLQEQQKELERQKTTQPQTHANPLQLTEYASPQRQNMLPVENTKECEVAHTALAPPQVTVNLESIEELLKQQAKDHKEMMQRLLESQRQQAQTLQNITQKVASLSLNQTIKPQADLSDASLHILQETLLEAVRTNVANGAPVDDEIAGKVEKIRNCIQVMITESESKDEAKKSLNMLNVILDNLRRHPDTEKYRKVNTTSARFKERFSSSQKADEFFTAVGFEASGPNFIFPSGPMSPTVQKAMNLIADTLKDLDDIWNNRGKSENTPLMQPTPMTASPWTAPTSTPERPDGSSAVAVHPAQSPDFVPTSMPAMNHPAESGVPTTTTVDSGSGSTSAINHPAESSSNVGPAEGDEGSAMTPGG